MFEYPLDSSIGMSSSATSLWYCAPRLEYTNTCLSFDGVTAVTSTYLCFPGSIDTVGTCSVVAAVDGCGAFVDCSSRRAFNFAASARSCAFVVNCSPSLLISKFAASRVIRRNRQQL